MRFAFPPLYGASSVKVYFIVPFRFSVRLKGPFLRPDLRLRRAPRGAGVKDGRRPPPEAARSVLDAGEHGARLVMPRRTFGLAIRSEGSSPCAPRGIARQPCIRPISTDRYHDAAFASAAKLRAAGPFYKSGTRAMGGSGTPPPRIVIGNTCSASRRAPNPLFYLYASSAVAEVVRFRPPDAAACRAAPCRC